MAIQSAWGLHALHELKLVHQDVKPANLLVTSDGVVKVSDFGLVKARARTGEAEQPTGEGEKSILVRYGGMSPPYCSPEQYAQKPLSRRTDIWSYGVSVLEMFTGDIDWTSGHLAPSALVKYLENGKSEEFLPDMPAGVAAVLDRCFKTDPADRWFSLLEAADRLKETYQKHLGQPYPRPIPCFVKEKEREFFEHDRRGTGGVESK